MQHTRVHTLSFSYHTYSYISPIVFRYYDVEYKNGITIVSSFFF